MKHLFALVSILAFLPGQMVAAQTAEVFPGSDLEVQRQPILSGETGATGIAEVRSIQKRLWSRSADVRASALQEAVYHAVFRSDLVDLRPVIGTLLVIATEDAIEANRIMAVQVLCHLGDPPSLLKLARAAGYESSARVQRIILSSVATVSRQQA